MPVKEKLPYTDHKVKVNGLRIHYTDWGNPHLPHLFLAHGGVANAYFWNLVAPALRDSYHVVAVTARGRGKSEYSTEGKYDYDQDYVQDFRGLTTRLGMDRLIYVGQSMGGRIGMSYVGTYPEQVERLILVDIGAEVSVRFPKGDPVTDRPEVFNSFAEAEAWLRQFDRFARIGSEAMDIVLKTSFQRLINGQLASTIDRKLIGQRQQSASDGRPTWRSAWDLLPRIQCPTLLIRGTLSDILSPEVAHRTRDTIPNCKLVEIKSGHLPQLENPSELIRVVREFLEGREATGT